MDKVLDEHSSIPTFADHEAAKEFAKTLLQLADIGIGELTDVGAVSAALAQFYYCDNQMYLATAHAGNCRLYLFRKPDLHVLSVDHAFIYLGVDGDAAGVQALIDAVATPEDLQALPPQLQREFTGRDEVYQALGQTNPFIAAAAYEVQQGDRIMICSDGVHSVLTSHMIQAILKEGGPPHDAAMRLSRGARLYAQEHTIRNEGRIRDGACAYVVEVPTPPTRLQAFTNALREGIRTGLGDAALRRLIRRA